MQVIKKVFEKIRESKPKVELEFRSQYCEKCILQKGKIVEPKN